MNPLLLPDIIGQVLTYLPDTEFGKILTVCKTWYYCTYTQNRIESLKIYGARPRVVIAYYTYKIMGVISTSKYRHVNYYYLIDKYKLLHTLSVIFKPATNGKINYQYIADKCNFLIDTNSKYFSLTENNTNHDTVAKIIDILESLKLPIALRVYNRTGFVIMSPIGQEINKHCSICGLCVYEIFGNDNIIYLPETNTYFKLSNKFKSGPKNKIFPLSCDYVNKFIIMFNMAGNYTRYKAGIYSANSYYSFKLSKLPLIKLSDISETQLFTGSFIMRIYLREFK